jgi:hypothetical protein
MTFLRPARCQKYPYMPPMTRFAVNAANAKRRKGASMVLHTRSVARHCTAPNTMKPTNHQDNRPSLSALEIILAAPGPQ